MKRIIFGLASAVTLFVGANAQAGTYGMAGCGLGSLFLGERDGMEQILAATTNQWSSSQTSGITSGTSNCSDSREVASAMFITVNQQVLKADMARGNGESLNALAELMDCSNSKIFGESMKRNFGQIFPSEKVSGAQVGTNIRQVIESDVELSKNCAAFEG